MLNKLVTYIFLSALLLHTISQAFIVVDYLANTELITKVFCINKEKPKMHCNGKCYLAKQLKKDEDQKPKNVERSVEIVMICQANDFTLVEDKVEFLILRKDIFAYSEPVAFEYQSAVFHPPTV